MNAMLTVDGAFFCRLRRGRGLGKTGASLGYLYISINDMFCQDRAGRMF